MTVRYPYRPKFVDIRVRKPPKPAARSDVQTCQHPGCLREATARAPKSRDNPSELWMFCQEHAALYNRNWNYFDGMSDADWQAHQSGELHGQRPTWSFKAARGSREGRGWRAAATGEAWSDTFEAFRSRREGRARAEAQEARVPAPVRSALDELGLPETAAAPEVRQAYAELVRRYHPDSNGGDRSAEARLGAVVKAYKVLKTARRA